MWVPVPVFTGQAPVSEYGTCFRGNGGVLSTKGAKGMMGWEVSEGGYRLDDLVHGDGEAFKRRRGEGLPFAVDSHMPEFAIAEQHHPDDFGVRVHHP